MDDSSNQQLALWALAECRRHEWQYQLGELGGGGLAEVVVCLICGESRAAVVLPEAA